MLRQRRMPSDKFGRAAQVQPGRCQDRHMQHLADMAGGIGTVRVLVEERAARGKIEQRSARQERYGTAR